MPTNGFVPPFVGIISFLSVFHGAGGGIWTHTSLRTLAPEASSSASSNTPAYIDFRFFYSAEIPEKPLRIIYQNRRSVSIKINLLSWHVLKLSHLPIPSHLRIKIQQPLTEHIILYHNTFVLSSTFFKKPNKFWLTTSKTVYLFINKNSKEKSIFV